MKHDTALRLLIADDHELVLDTLAHYLQAQPDLSVTTAKSADEALAAIAGQGPFDLVLLDYQMPGMNGLDGLDAAIATNGGNVALMSGTAALPLIERALDRGARGFIPKTLAARSFLNAVRFIASGELFVPSEVVSGSQQANSPAADLKPIEMQVLMHLCEGRPNKEIAHALGLTEVSVKMHVKSICGKLGASNRTQAVIAAKRANIF